MQRRTFLTLIASNLPAIGAMPQSAIGHSRTEPELSPGSSRRVNCSFVQEMQREMDVAGISQRDVLCPLCGEQITLVRDALNLQA